MHGGSKTEKSTSPPKRTIESTEVKVTPLDSDLAREVPASPPSSPQVFDTGKYRFDFKLRNFEWKLTYSLIRLETRKGLYW
jgi:hypothetical protein